MPIRQRIAFATAGVMILLLFLLSIGVHVAMSRNLYAEVDSRLQSVYDAYIRTPARIQPLPDGRLGVTLPEINPITSPGLYMQVLNSRGVVVEQSVTLEDTQLPVPQEVAQANAGGEDAFFETQINEVRTRVYSAPAYVEGNPAPVAYVQVAESLEPVETTLRELRNILFFGSLLATVIVSTVAWFLAGAVMRPMARMSATAEAIGGAQDLSQRLDSPATGDEVERLAAAFNAMLDRLENSFESQRRFVADASHEMRTPLTALRGNTDIMRRMVKSGSIDRDDLLSGLDDVGGEVDRLTRLVQDLLTLARADVGFTPEMRPVDVGEVARDAIRTIAPLTDHHPVTASIDDATPLTVSGSADGLKQLVLILLDNALTHTPEGTSVAVQVRREDDRVVLAVADDGEGIAPEHQQRIFERFYRPDESRTRSAGGTGLGLAIAQWIVTTHRGTITVDSTPGEGATFTVTLPALNT